MAVIPGDVREFTLKGVKFKIRNPTERLRRKWGRHIRGLKPEEYAYCDPFTSELVRDSLIEFGTINDEVGRPIEDVEGFIEHAPDGIFSFLVAEILSAGAFSESDQGKPESSSGSGVPSTKASDGTVGLALSQGLPRSEIATPTATRGSELSPS